MTKTHDWPAFQAALAKAELLMLDFDGPICSVFAGLPAPEVADRLREHLRSQHPGPLPGLDQTGPDPFDVLAYAVTHKPEHATTMEAEFTRLECQAVQTAEPTPGAHPLIKEWDSTGRPLAIVSNNSVDSISKYLACHGLTDAIALVSARTSQVVDQLKPAPYLIYAALNVAKVEACSAIFIGDSLTDMEAGMRTGVTVIGFANRPWKRESLGPLCEVLIEKFHY